MYIGRRRVIATRGGTLRFPALNITLNLKGASWTLRLQMKPLGSVLEVRHQDGSVEPVELPPGYYLVTKKVLDKLKQS
jgi:hypothetical protein